MQLILDIGQLMMENGASSKRVVRDMLRAALLVAARRRLCADTYTRRPADQLRR